MNGGINNQIVGYDPQTGQPIYANQNNQINNNFVTNQNVNRENIHLDKAPIVLTIIGTILILLAIPFAIFDKSLSRTIMIYMVGANLESEASLATVDLEGIDYNLMDNKNINVVVIAGGAKRWSNDYIDVSETSIYELNSSGFAKVKAQSLQNMGDSKVLSDYLNYVYDNYKSDEYDLIFWNHGSGIMGSEVDELTDDLLSLEDLRNGLAGSRFNKKNKLETVAFRTCLNGAIEVANVFKDYAKYFIASEEITRGAAVDNVLGFINDIVASDDAYDYGVKFIDSYKGQIESIREIIEMHDLEDDIYSTYSIIDLSKLDALENSVNDFFNSIDVASNYNAIAKVRSNLYQYAPDEPAYDMVDLYNLVYGLRELSPDKADRVLNNFENTIIYNWATNDKSRGLSIYFPYSGGSNYKQVFLKIHNEFDAFKAYNGFITKFNSIQTASYRNYSFSNNLTSLESEHGESDFTLKLTDEQKTGYAKADYIVFRTNNDGYYLPVYRSSDVSLNGNTLNANIQNKQLRVVDTESGEGDIITLFETNVDDKYIRYEAIVVLEYIPKKGTSGLKMDTAKLSLLYDKSKDETKIINAFLSSKNDNVPGNIVAVDLNDYTHIAFANSKYKILDGNEKYSEDWESNGIIEGIEVDVGKFEFKRQTFDDEYDYYCVFKIYDVDNNYYYSKLVKMN